MSFFFLFRDGEPAEPGSESLGAGDLTTALSFWLSGKTIPKNESVRDALNTHYGTSYTDIQPLISRFVRDRE